MHTYAEGFTALFSMLMIAFLCGLVVGVMVAH
jgi:hypothetical protein